VRRLPERDDGDCDVPDWRAASASISATSPADASAAKPAAFSASA